MGEAGKWPECLDNIEKIEQCWKVASEPHLPCLLPFSKIVRGHRLGGRVLWTHEELRSPSDQHARAAGAHQADPPVSRALEEPNLLT